MLWSEGARVCKLFCQGNRQMNSLKKWFAFGDCGVGGSSSRLIKEKCVDTQNFKKLILEILVPRIVKSKVAIVFRFLQKILVKELIFRSFSSLVTSTVNYLTSIFHGFWLEFCVPPCIMALLFQSTSQWMFSCLFILY